MNETLFSLLFIFSSICWSDLWCMASVFIEAFLYIYIIRSCRSSLWALSCIISCCMCMWERMCVWCEIINFALYKCQRSLKSRPIPDIILTFPFPITSGAQHPFSIKLLLLVLHWVLWWLTHWMNVYQLPTIIKDGAFFLNSRLRSNASRKVRRLFLVRLAIELFLEWVIEPDVTTGR